jgi:hypothetical protein
MDKEWRKKHLVCCWLTHKTMNSNLSGAHMTVNSNLSGAQKKYCCCVPKLTYKHITLFVSKYNLF